MKVISAQAMAALEKRAYQEGCKEADFMENAGRGIAKYADQFIQTKFLTKNKILILCGKGNNGGDAFVAARYLLKNGYSVQAIMPERIEKGSPLCRENAEKFIEAGGSFIQEFLPENYDIILDGIFGTGFRGRVEEPYASLIKQANNGKIPILAIDIPSGLNGSTGETGGDVIYATQTIYLGLAKTGFFLHDAWNYVGELKHVDFGLPKHLIDEIEADFILTEEREAAKLLPKIKRNRHKYQAGQVIGIAGSPGMPGASLLASLAALRAGCGIVRLLHPKGMEAELSSAPYELIKIGYSHNDIENVVEHVKQAKALFIGPGMGIGDEVGKFLNKISSAIAAPCVIDADALTHYSNHQYKLPQRSIMTPHTGEMQRLLHREERLGLNQDTIKICQEYANKHDTTLILKGAPTFIFQKGTKPYVNPSGDPGMATAGSGDVLTGLLAGLLAQGCSCHEAAVLGVYLHGLAGEFAAKAKTSYCMISGDLIQFFSFAFAKLA